MTECGPSSHTTANTNIPKHLGGPIFAFVFEAAMMIIIALSTCADF